MTTIKYLILFLFLISYNKKNKETVIIIPDNELIQNDIKELESDIDNKVNDSVYAISKENRESFINLFYSKDKKNNITFDSIIIKIKTNNDIQKIKLKKDYFLFDWETEYCLSTEEDINFDGFSDISVINYKGNYNSSYSHWIYKKNQKKYKQIKSLDSLYNLVFDNVKKEINSEWRVAFEEFHFEKYFWKNDQIILKEQEIKYTTHDSINPEVMFSRKLINGKYIEKGVKY